MASIVAGGLLLFAPPHARAQYMYLDSNGNGVHDAGDRLRTCVTQVDVWLNTQKNRDGTAAVCPVGIGAMSLGHYEFVLHSVGGTVLYGAMTNLLPGGGTSLVRDARDTDGPVYYHNGTVLATVQPPGLYKLATLKVEVATGSPRLDIISTHPANGTGRTSFGSACPATVLYDHTNRHGTTWSDVDGLTAALGVDTAPAIAGPDVTVFFGQPVYFTVMATDADADPIQTLTADLSLLPPGNDAVYTSAGQNTPTMTGTLFWHPAAVGDYSVTFTAGNCLLTPEVVAIHVLPTPTGAEATESRPVNFLGANQPNPFAPSTTIDYSLERAGNVRLNVYSADGRLVQTLVHARMPAGPQRISWNGTDDSGRPVASGVYWCRLESGSFRMSRRMILLR